MVVARKNIVPHAHTHTQMRVKLRSMTEAGDIVTSSYVRCYVGGNWGDYSSISEIFPYVS